MDENPYKSPEPPEPEPRVRRKTELGYALAIVAGLLLGPLILSPLTFWWDDPGTGRILIGGAIGWALYHYLPLASNT